MFSKGLILGSFWLEVAIFGWTRFLLPEYKWPMFKVDFLLNRESF